MLPARVEAMEFLNHLKVENRRLADLFDPNGPETYFDMDMSKYPEVGNWGQSPEIDLIALEAQVQVRLKSLNVGLVPLNPDDQSQARDAS